MSGRKNASLPRRLRVTPRLSPLGVEVALEVVDDLVVDGAEAEVADVALDGDDEVIGTQWIATTRSKLGVAAERLADPALEAIAHDGIADLARDGDAHAALSLSSGEELEDEPPPVHAPTLSLDPQELRAPEDPAAVRKTLPARGSDVAARWLGPSRLSVVLQRGFGFG
jgi:hypothetical protein